MKRSEQFLFDPKYDITPPPPQIYPKTLHYPLDPNRHHQHRHNALFMSQLKGLHIPVDLCLPVDELVLFQQQYNGDGTGQLHPDDQILINQQIMFQKETK